MLKMRYKDLNNPNDTGLDTLIVGKNDYILRSFNWWDTDDGTHPLTGMEINIGDGKIKAYSSNGAMPGYQISIDASDDGTIPFMIGT
jgi:hypothetical protein